METVLGFTNATAAIKMLLILLLKWKRLKACV